MVDTYIYACIYIAVLHLGAQVEELRYQCALQSSDTLHSRQMTIRVVLSASTLLSLHYHEHTRPQWASACTSQCYRTYVPRVARTLLEGLSNDDGRACGGMKCG